MKSIDEYLQSIKNTDYGYYYDDRYFSPGSVSIGKTYWTRRRARSLNCYDEFSKGSRNRIGKIEYLSNILIPIEDGCFNEISDIVVEMHNIMKEECIQSLGCTEKQADILIDAYIDFNHFPMSRDKDGNKYLRVKPKFGFKY